MLSVRDRLSEMRLIQSGGTASQNQDADLERGEIIDQTYQEAESIREQIELIESNTSKANEIFKINVFKISKDTQTELDELFHSTTSTAYKINSSLKEFHKTLKNLRNTNSTEYRIKKIQFNTLKQSFKEAVRESSNCLEYHKQTRKDLLKRALQTVNKNIEEEELEALLDENKLDTFTDNLLVSSQEARQELADIEERHAQLLKIEKHLNEVLDLFIKLATLVEQQQESIDRVEFHAETATEAVVHGAVDLGKGAKSKRKSYKRKMYLILILIVILLVIILFLVI